MHGKYSVQPIPLLQDNGTASSLFPKPGSDYKIGLPYTQEQRKIYLEKLKSAIRAIHMAGVVHLDLYLSNIMWKELESGKIELKIIDWDECSTLYGREFVPRCSN